MMIRKWIKGIIKEALIEWEQEVEYLGREGYNWENNEWVPVPKKMELNNCAGLKWDNEYSFVPAGQNDQNDVK